MKSSRHIQVYRAQESNSLPATYWPILTKRRRKDLAQSREYLDLQKAADALIRRYLRGRFVGMDQIGYPKETPYIWHPPREGGGAEALDPQLRSCAEMIHAWPAAIGGVVRMYWDENKTINRISLQTNMDRRKISAIISTIRYKVIQSCIEPSTLRG